MAKRMSWTQADGKALRKERRGLGISQADLGKLAGVTGSRVCEVETVVFPNGRRCTPALKLAEKLDKALGQVKARQAKAEAKKAGRQTDRDRQVAAQQAGKERSLNPSK